MTSGNSLQYRYFKFLSCCFLRSLVCRLFLLCFFIFSSPAFSQDDLEKLSLISSDSSKIHFSEFVITPEKFQKLMWREFLVNFKSLYAKQNFRAYRNNANTSVVFYDSNGKVEFTIDFTSKQYPLSKSRIERIVSFKITDNHFGNPVEVVIKDIGENLQKIDLKELVRMKLPLELTEEGLKSKKVTLYFQGNMPVEIDFQLNGDLSRESKILMTLISENTLAFRVHDIRGAWNRELIWYLDRQDVFGGAHRLSVFKTKTDKDLFGSEDFYIDTILTTPKEYLNHFSVGFSGSLLSIQAVILQLPNGLNETLKFLSSKKTHH
jgi:hypothetical protein